MSDAKQRAQAGLADLVDEALKVVACSLRGTLVRPRGSTSTVDAWKTLNVILERPDEADLPEQRADGTTATDDLADRREALKQALRTRRADPSR